MTPSTPKARDFGPPTLSVDETTRSETVEEDNQETMVKRKRFTKATSASTTSKATTKTTSTQTQSQSTKRSEDKVQGQINRRVFCAYVDIFRSPGFKERWSLQKFNINEVNDWVSEIGGALMRRLQWRHCTPYAERS